LSSRRFIVALIVGCLVEGYFLYASGSRLARYLENSSLDWVNRMYEGTEPVQGRPSVPFTIIDIDDQTYRAWKEPLAIPTEALLQLIQFAVEQGAMAVVVDVDLSDRTGAETSWPITQYLKARPLPGAGAVTRRAPAPRPVPVVFVRGFQLYRGGAKARASALDDVVREGRALYWASPLFDRDEDFVVRRWRLWQATCGASQGDVVPAVQLVILSLTGSPQPWTAGLDGALAPLREYACGGRPESASREGHDRQRLQLGRVTLEIEPDDLERRVIYTIPWKLASGDARPSIVVDGKTVPLLIAIPAHRIASDPRLVAPDAVRNRVVVIGGSFTDGRDIHLTPIGAMPGAFLLANAIHSILQYGELHHLPWWLRLAVVAGMVLVISLSFHCYGAMRGLALSLVVVALLAIASVRLFHDGLWLEFASSFVGVLVHSMPHIVENLSGRPHDRDRHRVGGGSGAC
jgi:hypothetical protein